ncbi:type 1 glutamine amidotransferase-like domain-containing protein [Paenibacillus albicereus]|uniref:Type 1 glutamine amidotransferase-like domain-containing protein n=1 Tax=Paenibacillus albicereus TaxID=2726185 RepID=A0A6H2GT42_9BACL|nr:Type 1 glutamine amidotransferase-like domain-containing protein [Paenibacillus albicereus]QJC50601.1 type 1 glutamine amidotransferase-like domain-containing protein [Paenibacillus albicereus]
MDKHLFLFGGGPPFTPGLARRFVDLAGGAEAEIGILCLDRPGWRDYMPRYIEELEACGVTRFRYLPLPTVSVEEAVKSLRTSTGIVIGGGDTSRYAGCIVDTAIGQAVRERAESGVPVSGFSAGALICPERCLISPKDNEEAVLQDRSGLGLIGGVAIAVHFSQWREEAHLRAVSERYPSGCEHYGIDEQCGLYFRNGRLERTEGEGLFRLEGGELRRISVE